MMIKIEKALFVNRAPFDNIEINFKEKGINVLSAINGKGKTTILSHIIDAFYELSRPYYSNEYAGKSTKYYRVSSPLDVIDNKKVSIVFLQFKNDDNILNYVDIRNELKLEDYDKYLIGCNIPYKDIEAELKETRNVKRWTKTLDRESVQHVFENNIISYFPAYRYEIPGYLNDPYQDQLSFKTHLEYSGYLPNKLEVVSDIPNLANWLMDLVLDCQIYDEDEWKQLKNSFNVLLNQTLASKIDGKCRLGIGPRNNAGFRISIVKDEPDGKVKTIYPSIFNLSSGENAMLCIFGELLRQADRINKLLDVTGIVLIDEIDKHLHIKLQKEILPQLLKLFPNIQFIISSHSPFLNMGLADYVMERAQIIDLDNNGIICEPTNNDLYNEVYEMMINENERFASKCNDLENKINNIKKPIVITEGKTDWKHLKAAWNKLKSDEEYKDFDLEIIEYDFDFGDSKLHSLLNQYKLFPHKYKVIGIFDCDEQNGKAIHVSGGKRKYGSNIWGMSIPIPDFRVYNESGISIEFLYKNEDLKKLDANGRRLFVTSEFNENGRLKENKTIGVKNNHDVKNYILSEKEKIQADEVIDIEGKSLALSKEDFARNILESVGDFANVDIEAFKAVFNRLKEILLQED